MIKRNNILFAFILLLLFSSCDNRSQNEKLKDELESNPELLEQFRDSLGMLILAATPVELGNGTFPSYILNETKGSEIVQALSADLNGDNKREVVLLLKSKKESKEKLILFEGKKMISTKWMNDIYKESSLKISYGIINWQRIDEDSLSKTKVEYKFKYENPTQNYKLVLVENEKIEYLNSLRTSEKITRIMINYKLHQKNIIRIDRDNGVKIRENKSNEKISGHIYSLNDLEEDKIKIDISITGYF